MWYNGEKWIQRGQDTGFQCKCHWLPAVCLSEALFPHLHSFMTSNTLCTRKVFRFVDTVDVFHLNLSLERDTF